MKYLLLALATVIATLILGGCGSDSSPATTTTFTLNGSSS